MTSERLMWAFIFWLTCFVTIIAEVWFGTLLAFGCMIHAAWPVYQGITRLD